MIRVVAKGVEMGLADLGHLVMNRTMTTRSDPRRIRTVADHLTVEEDHLTAHLVVEDHLTDHLVVEDRLTARQMGLVTRGMGKTNLTKKTVQLSKKWRIL